MKNVLLVPKKSSNLDDDIIITENLSIKEIGNIITKNDPGEEEFRIPAYNADEISETIHVALNLKSKIDAHPTNKNAELTEANAYACIPELLYIFIAILTSRGMALEADDSDILNQEAHEEAWSLRRCIMNLCIDIVYIVSDK